MRPEWRTPVGWRDVKPARWRVIFDRVGRNHDVPPLDLPDAAPDDLVEAIHAYARQGLLSHEVDVTVDVDRRVGHILCGFNSGGSFRLDDHPDWDGAS